MSTENNLVEIITRYQQMMQRLSDQLVYASPSAAERIEAEMDYISVELNREKNQLKALLGPDGAKRALEEG